MQVALTDQQEQHLNELARHEGKNVGDLLVDAADHLLRTEEQRWKDIELAIGQADRNEILDEAEMDRRFAKMLSK